MFQERKDRPRAPKKEIFGWAMFDFANQALHPLNHHRNIPGIVYHGNCRK